MATASESQNPKITNNLKTIYDRINERISYLLIEKIKKVAIEALKKIKPAEEKKEEPVSIEPLKKAIINKLQDILPKEEDKEKEEDSQKSLIITFQNNPITLPDENVSIEPLKNAVINKLKQIIPDETKEEEVKDVKIEKTEGEPPRIPDFPGVYYYVFPDQGVWPDKNYPFSDSNTQTGGAIPHTPNAVNIQELHEKYSSVYKEYENNQNLYNVAINDSIENLYNNRKEVIKLYNMYYYMNINKINKNNKNNNVNIANKVVDTNVDKHINELFKKSSEYTFLSNQDNTNIIDFSST
jgi:hypothetical protein